jgi:4-amino-4-deoxy-L-arabinose transferase-like glycosyltransferase
MAKAICKFPPRVRAGRQARPCQFARSASPMHAPSNPDTRFRPTFIFLALITATAVVRIILTYNEFNQVWDEPAHIACGMEWLQRGKYTLEPQHPPLARVADALGPYLAGSRLVGHGDMWQEGNEILYGDGRYFYNLTLARLGVLPFFLLSVGVVWLWARRLFGEWAALLAVALYTMQPVVLAHAGFATTDMALNATVVLALFAFVTWLDKPNYSRSVLLGLATALAVVSKFSTLVFLPAAGLGILVSRWISAGRPVRPSGTRIRNLLKPLAVSIACAFVLVWAAYRFSFYPVSTAANRPHVPIDHLFGNHGTLHDLAYALDEAPIPAPELVKGIEDVRDHAVGGHRAYMFGRLDRHGWWYFFPVTLAVKTPIAFQLLAGIGLIFLLNDVARGRNFKPAEPAVAAGAILLVCMASPIDIGIRHILPVFPLMAITAAFGGASLCNSSRSRWLAPVVALLLVSDLVIVSALAHPNYLAYFNRLAGDHPERILVKGDLDWGQDLSALQRVLRSLHVEKLALSYSGTADPSQMGLPAYSPLLPRRPTKGWVAISLENLKIGVPSDQDAFAWLENYKPVAVAGRSIWVYYIPTH